MSKFCHNCGTQLDDNVSFCANCGTQLEVPTTPVSEPQIQYQAPVDPQPQYQAPADPQTPNYGYQEPNYGYQPTPTPETQAPKKKKKKKFVILGIIAALVVLAIIGIIVGGSSNNDASSSTPTTPESLIDSFITAVNNGNESQALGYFVSYMRTGYEEDVEDFIDIFADISSYTYEISSTYNYTDVDAVNSTIKEYYPEASEITECKEIEVLVSYNMDGTSDKGYITFTIAKTEGKWQILFIE